MQMVDSNWREVAESLVQEDSNALRLIELPIRSRLPSVPL